MRRFGNDKKRKLESMECCLIQEKGVCSRKEYLKGDEEERKIFCKNKGEE